VISFHRKALNIQEFNFNTVRNSQEAHERKLNLVNCWDEEVKIDLGQATEISGKYALKSLQAAAADLKENKIDGIVTAPINKKVMQQEGFNFPGHTEYFANLYGSKDQVMMLVSEVMRVAFVTGHVQLRQVGSQITKDKIVSKLKVINESLKRDFGIRKPRLAVLGLNPHAGDGGLLGNEEIEIITPAVNEAFEAKLLAYGPYPADGFFGSASLNKFDAVLAMYHDQGLIPFKTISFSNGVNYTAGLPCVRTSPDHGTAYDIAGKGIASEDSFRQAIYLACEVIRKRKEYDTANANPLKYAKLGGDR
jgi:4-hydroxythreonine-4-phosphate dehydrogenase